MFAFVMLDLIFQY